MSPQQIGLLASCAFGTVVLFAYVVLTVRDARREGQGVKAALATERAENDRLARSLADCHREQLRVEAENRRLGQQVLDMSQR